MRGALESLSDDEDLTITFLRHVITVRWGFVREKEVYEEVQKHTIAEGPAVEFANQLEDLSGWYVAIQNPEHERWNAYSDTACRALEAINLFDIVPMRPLVLAAARRFSPKDAEGCFRLLVALSVRLMVTNGTRTGSTEQHLANAAYKVFSNEVTSNQELITKLKDLTPTDAEFRQAMESCVVTSHKFARYYLRSLEMQARAQPEPWHIPNDDKDAINLEHILPQRPSSEWQQFDEDQVKIFCKRLGNMVLIQKSQNMKLQNNGFAAKRAAFEGSPYTLTDQVATCSDWTAAEINKRQKLLAKLGKV